MSTLTRIGIQRVEKKNDIIQKFKTSNMFVEMEIRRKSMVIN